MTFKCLNPECNETFRRGRKGGVLIFNDPKNGAVAAVSQRYFWLCEQCFTTYEFLTRERQAKDRHPRQRIRDDEVRAA